MDSIKTMKKLGVSIKRLRKKAGLSQTELSSLTGLRQATISKVESTGSGQIESLMRIIQALNSSISLDSEKVGEDGFKFYTRFCLSVIFTTRFHLTCSTFSYN